MTRPSRAGWVRFPHSPAIAFSRVALVLLVILVMRPGAVAGQQTDSARAGVTQPAPAETPARDRNPALSPRRAFLMSLLAPGSMQLRLGRRKAATIFLAAEAGTLGMSLKSWNDLRKAKAARADTVGTPVLDTSGNPVIDPVTGLPQVTYSPRNPNLAGRVRARRAHLEDWLAVVVFNHLFAGADAYVAANLADFDANVEVSEAGSRMRLAARIAW